MTQTSKGGSFSLAFVVFMMTLAAAAGVVLTLIVGAIATQVGPFPERKATSARCQCDDADRTAGDEASALALDQDGEVRRAFLAALTRSPRYEDTPAPQPNVPTPPDFPVASSEFSAEPPAAYQEDFARPSREEIAEQEEAEVASLEGELEQESVDPVWAPATEQSTAGAIAAVESVYLEDVTCGESLCRVQVTHRDLAQREEDVEKLLATIPGGGQARVYAPSDEPTTVMYFSREGKQLSVMTPSEAWVPGPPLDPMGQEAMDPAAEGEGEIPPPPVMPQ